MNVGGMTDVTDHLGASFFWSVGSVFARYPEPAPGVTVEDWVTQWPNDPVMFPRFGHRPAPAGTGPPSVRHILPPGGDHNTVLLEVIRELLRRSAGDR
jgi:hypothetical protein